MRHEGDVNLKDVQKYQVPWGSKSEEWTSWTSWNAEQGRRNA